MDWYQNYGQGSGRNVILCSNDDYAIVGRLSQNIAFIRLNESGELISQYDFGPGYGNGIIELENQDFILVGSNKIIV